MKLGTAFVEVRPDTKGFKRDLEQQTTQSASQVSTTLGRALAGGAFLAGAKKATDAASQLEQAVGGTAATFGEASTQIDAFAGSSAEALGISARAARELTSQIGGLLQGFGFTQDEAAKTSISLATLGADLAATFGGKPEEAVQALGAALRGETDPLERFGIALNQTLVNQKAVDLGLAASTSAVDQRAKAEATLALIMERSVNAQGQAAREADTAAGQQVRAAAKAEDAAASMGENLLPIYTRINQVVGAVADTFGALPGPVQTGLIALAGIAVVAGPARAAADAIGSLATMARRAPEALDKAAVGTYNLAGGASRVSRALAGLGLAGAVAGLAAYANSLNDVNVDAEQLERQLANLDDANEESIRQNIIAQEAMGGLDEVFRQTADSSVPLAERLLEQAEAAGASKERLAELQAIIDEKRTTDVQAAEDQATYSAEVQGAADATTNLTDATKEQVDALAELLDATLAQFDSNIGYRRSIDEVEDSTRRLHDVAMEHGFQSEEYRDALLEVEQALLDQADAAVRMAEDTAEANDKTLTGVERTYIYRAELNKLRDGLAPGSQLRKALDGYIATLDAIPGEIVTSVRLEIPTRNPDLRRGSYTAGYAAGGDIMDGDFIVGEAGRPELLRKRGSDVEVIAGGAPTPLASDMGTAEVVAELRSLRAVLDLIAGNTAGPTTGQRLRRIQTTAGSI